MLLGRTGLSPVMVGRSAELDRLVRLLDDPSAPAVALVAGEAGIGKTRLVQELLGRLPPGTAVLAGQADPGTAPRPLDLFLDVLGGAPAGSPAADPADEVLSDLAATARDGTRSADERVRAAVDLVRRATVDTPAVVVFEDLHWADPESLTVFEQLAQPAGHRVLLVGTYRPDGLSRRHPAAELLLRLERRHSVSRIDLGRLTPAEVAGFLNAVHGETPPSRVVQALHARTGGNPFFLEELVASSAASAGMPGADLDAAPLPWTVTELVRAHVDEVDADVRRIVTAASVLGRRASFDLLAAVTGTAEDELITLLRSAIDAGLMVETDPDVFGFRHEIAREAIESRLLGRERRLLHEAALDALRRAGSRDHGAMARHAHGAARYDDMVEEARLGAEELLALGSSYQALHLAELGLSEADDDLALLSTAARAAWLAGAFDGGHWDRWLAVARQAGDVGEEAAALCLRGRVAYEAGEVELMASLTADIVGLIDQVPTDGQRAQVMAFVAQSFMLRGQVEASCEWADKALALADAQGQADVRLAAMVEKGSALLGQAGAEEEGRTLLRSAITEAERTGEHVLAARALNNLVWHASEWHRIDEARALVGRMRDHAEAAGWLSGSADSEALAHVAAVEGNLDLAIAHLEEGERRNAGLVLYTKSRWSAAFRAGLALEADDLDAAARYAGLAKPATERTRVSVVGLDLNLACRRGRLADAGKLLAELLAAASASGVASPALVHDVAAAWLRAGLAAGELRPLVELAGPRSGHRLAVDDPWRQLLDAQLAEAEGRTEDAARLYLAAAGGLTVAPGVLAGHRGTARTGAARCLVALGRLDEARSQAASAAGLLARWRGWRVTELRAVERRLGLGPEPSGPQALTPREREVAALLADGLTNAQLAQRLYISPRTAAVHVSNILAKLGMASRTEVAAWAAGGGLGSAAGSPAQRATEAR